MTRAFSKDPDDYAFMDSRRISYDWRGNRGTIVLRKMDA
jgi:hypothetical protein